MFSGIIEALVPCQRVYWEDDIVRITLKRPSSFSDLKLGDSLCCDGVCLTIVEYDSESIHFQMGHETLNITGWDLAFLSQHQFNLERSLKFGDRNHGHMVSGHVESKALLVRKEGIKSFLTLTFEVPEFLMFSLMEKGSVALNGVSLTVNKIDGRTFSVGLIPETLKRTNLGEIVLGDKVNIETDSFLRFILNTEVFNQLKEKIKSEILIELKGSL